MLNELIANVYSALSGDATLLASGINPASGASRTVTVVGQGKQSDVLPLVRITLTDSALLEPDAIPHDFSTQPEAERVMLLVNVFSDYEPECRAVAHRVHELLRHRQITTTNFTGFTWADSSTFYADGVSFPDRIVRVCALRVSCRMEPS